MSKNEFGAYLKKRRHELELTQGELAQKLGVAQNYITYLEKGSRNPSLETLKKLARALRSPLEQLHRLANPEVETLYLASEATLPPLLLELSRNKKLREMHRIGDEEIEQLAGIRARGEVRKVEDYLLLLMTMRQVFRD